MFIDMRFWWMLLIVLMFNSLVQAQQNKKIIISGTLFSDDPGKEPIEYGVVWIQGTTVGATTDKSGHYSIDVTAVNDTAKVYTLCGRYIAYHPKCLELEKLKKALVIDLGLKPNAMETRIEDKDISSP